jgi:hypothetical protein
MRTHRFGITGAVLGVAAALVAIGAATAAGPTPGVVTGSSGIAAPSGQVRYVTVTAAGETVLQKIATNGGRVLRFASLRGVYGIPLAAYDGTPTGLTRDGTSLVLSTYPVQATGLTRLAVVDTKTLKVRQRAALRGFWSLDALSPDGETLFLIQYALGSTQTTYRVRAYDLRAGRLIPGSIIDKTDPEAMTGLPMTRTLSADAAWAYTLYSRDVGSAFIHALDTAHRRAVCIDLPWAAGPDSLQGVQMRIANGSLVVSRRGVGRLATVDLESFTVHNVRSPAANATGGGLR